MADPKLRIRASGYGGSGYHNPLTGEKVIGVTTALGVIDKPGIKQWTADITAMYAVNNIDALLNRDHETGFRMLRWYHNRASEKKFDDPEVDIHNFHEGVLADYAQLGTFMHEWVEAFALDLFPEEEPFRDEHFEMIDVFLDWVESNDVEFTHNELTVFGDRIAGTLDGIWNINGVPTLVDIKTSKRVYETHIAQMAAYGAAEYGVVECDKDDEGAVKYKKEYFRRQELPAFSQYAVLQIRPADGDEDAYCKLHYITQEQIEAGFDLYQASVSARIAQKALKEATKKAELEVVSDDSGF